MNSMLFQLSGFTMLIIANLVKISVLLGLAYKLWQKWNAQDHKYHTDFPFLMMLTLILFSISKVQDLYMYIAFNGQDPSTLYNEETALLQLKIRFMVAPFGALIPLMILLMIIWFGGKKKVQIGVSSVWAILGVAQIIIASTYNSLLQGMSLLIAPVFVMLIITYGITHVQKKLPNINSLVLFVGHVLFLITQIIRPMWSQMGTGTWGLTWIGEFVELVALVILALGYLIPASYSEEQISNPNSKATSASLSAKSPMVFLQSLIKGNYER